MKTLKKGFTLVELIVVIGIMAILIVIVFPRLRGYTEKASEQVCEINSKELERLYNAYLITEGVRHGDNIFDQYLGQYGKDICPKGGNISYNDGSVKCSIHDEVEEDNGEDVPYL